jgi:hypothetical protein
MSDSTEARAPAFWRVLRSGIDGLTFLSIRLYGISDCGFEDIRNGRYQNRKYDSLNLDRAYDLELLLLQSRALLESATKSRDVVTEKCKTLLTLGSLVLSIIGVLVPNWIRPLSMPERIFCFLAGLCLLLSIMLLLVYFAIGSEKRLDLSQNEVELGSSDLKKSLINDHRDCAIATENRTDYLVDVYKASRAYFLTAFFLIFWLFSVNYFGASSNVGTATVVSRLQTNPNLIFLQGPKGDKGDRGEIGPKGEKGDPGMPVNGPSSGTRPSAP